MSNKKLKEKFISLLNRKLIGKVSATANRIYCHFEHCCKKNFAQRSNFHVLTSPAYLAERLGIHLATAYDALKELKEKKLIVENKTQEFIAVRSEVSGKSLKLGRSFSVLSLEGHEIFQKQQSDEEKDLPIEEQKMSEFETESPELATEHPEESPETVTKPIALDDMCNQLEIITNMMIKLKESMTAHKQNS